MSIYELVTSMRIIICKWLRFKTSVLKSEDELQVWTLVYFGITVRSEFWACPEGAYQEALQALPEATTLDAEFQSSQTVNPLLLKLRLEMGTKTKMHKRAARLTHYSKIPALQDLLRLCEDTSRSQRGQVCDLTAGVGS